MEDDLTNIETVIKIFKGELNPNEEMNYKLIKKEEKKDDNLTIYRIKIYEKQYEIYFPPITFIYKGLQKEIHSYLELIAFLRKDNIIDKFFKPENDNCVFSIKNLIFSKMEKFKFGLKYDILDNEKNEQLMSFKQFYEKYKSPSFFPASCKYYKIYCKSKDNFRYIQNDKSREFDGNLQDFILGKDKFIYITGQRGIGKTTTILEFFYEKKYPFFYINFKYFKNSKNEQEQSKIINFEKNNLFRFLSITTSIYILIEEKNYNKKINEKLENIRAFAFNNNNDNAIKIEFIIMIIETLSLIYGYIKFKMNDHISNNIIIENIKKYIKENIEKIKLLNLSEDIIKKERYDIYYLMEKDNLLDLIISLSYYRAYISYLIYNQNSPEYKPNNIFEFIEILLNKFDNLNLGFILILDQYQNILDDKDKLDKIINQNKNSKIIICSSIDDYEIREALINGFPPYINYQESFINLEDIKNEYKDLFKNFSAEKNKIIELYKDSTREIFDCLDEKDDNLKVYNNKKIEKIKNYFKKFCKGNLQRISFINFLFRKIDYYWEKNDYNEIKKFIPFKYVKYKKIEILSLLSENKLNMIGKLEKDDEDVENNNNSEITSNNRENTCYYKFNYSMPIVENCLYQFIRTEDNIKYNENYIKSTNKGAGKGISFEEFIKSKIIKGLIKPIKNKIINESIEIWSFFSKPSSNNIPGLFEGKLKENAVYFVDMRNQIEPMFDCAIIDLIKNQIFFIQITISKKLTEEVFDKDKVKEKSKKALEFIKGNLIDENIILDVGFFFIFLKFKLDRKPEYLDPEYEKLLNYMKKINKHLENMKNKCKCENLNYIIYNLINVFSDNNKKIEIEYNQIEESDKNLFILKRGKIKLKLNKNEDIHTNEDIKTNFDINEDINTTEVLNNNNINDNNINNNINDNMNNNINNNINNNVNNNINNNINENINNNINNINENLDINQDINTNDNINNYKIRRNYLDMSLNSNNLVEIDLEQNQNLNKIYIIYSQIFELSGGKIYKDQRLHSFQDLEIYCKNIKCFGVINDDDDENDFTNFNIIYYKNEMVIMNINNNEISNINNQHKKLLYNLYFIGNIHIIKSDISDIENQIKLNRRMKFN